MKLNDFYVQLMHALGLVVDTDGFVSRKEGDKIVPLTIKDQRLVLPFDAQMQNPDFSARIAFNPLYESLTRKESPVHEAFRTILNIRLNTIFGILLGTLLKVSRDTDKHAHLKPEQTEFLSFVKKVDKDSLKNYEKMIKAFVDEDSIKGYADLLDAFPGDRALVNIYSKNGGVVNALQEDGSFKAEKFSRAAIVSFPAYEALAAAKDGVVAAPGKSLKMRPKDIDAFKKVMEYLIPNIAKKDYYHVGSLSQMAPIMESVLKAAAKLFGYFNEQLELFADQIAGAEDLIVPMDWVDEIDRNIGALYTQARRVGMLEGNEGQVVNAPAAAQPAATAPAQAAPAPAPKKQTLINPITGEPVVVSGAPVAASPFPVPAAAQPWAPPPAFNGNAQPWNGGYQPTPPAPPSIVKANGKADFMAILANNPALAQQVGVSTQSFQGQYQSPQTRTPGWAQGAGYSAPVNKPF
jgi:hypothetical protein